MKRRQVLRTLVSLPGIAALPARGQEALDKSKAPAHEKAPAEIKPQPPEETPKLAVSAPDLASEAVPRFFTEPERATLGKLAAAIAPPLNGRPGAAEAQVPEFLDFLIEKSPASRQKLYRNGLALLSNQAQFEQMLGELKRPWTHAGPPDVLGQFLQAVKEDILRATFNSREWATNSSGRRGGGVGTYWYPVE